MKKFTSLIFLVMLSSIGFSQEIPIVSVGASIRDTYSIEYCQVFDEMVYSVEVGARGLPLGIKGKKDEEAKFGEFPENVKKTKHYYAGIEFGVGRRLKNWLIIGTFGYYPRYKARSWYDPEEELGRKGHYYNIFNASHDKVTLGIKVKHLIPLGKKKKNFLALGTKFSAFDGVGFTLGYAYNVD
ncbi:hypothetical protein EMN47_00895 [Prolixibacteraceae bacterium JC049]|nr:hypothetical protein [Prolixibacteraceae bacterium JC049]